MSDVLVSVVICTYNGEKYLAKTLESVLSQTYPTLEVLIIDDGSKDQTAALVRSFMEKDSRIRLVEKKNGGLASARNRGFSEAKGEWIAIIDQDDLCYPERIEEQLRVARNHPTAGLIFSDTHYIDPSDQVIGRHLERFDLPKEAIPKMQAARLLLKNGCFIDSEAAFIRKSVWNACGRFDETLTYACDFEYFIRVGKSYDFAYSDKILSAWRIHPSQETARNIKRHSETRLVLSKHRIAAGLFSSDLFIYLKNLTRSYVAQLVHLVRLKLNAS